MTANATKPFSFGYTQIGASSDVGLSWSLPQTVGLRRANGIAFLGESLSADQALEFGIANSVVGKDELQAATSKLVMRLANGPTMSYAETKRLMRSSFNRSLGEQFDEELLAFQRCSQTYDFSEGVSAFLERRKSSFRGA